MRRDPGRRALPPPWRDDDRDDFGRDRRYRDRSLSRSPPRRDRYGRDFPSGRDNSDRRSRSPRNGRDERDSFGRDAFGRDPFGRDIPYQPPSAPAVPARAVGGGAPAPANVGPPVDRGPSMRADAPDDLIAQWQQHIAAVKRALGASGATPPDAADDDREAAKSDARVVTLAGADFDETTEPPPTLWQALEEARDEEALALIRPGGAGVDTLGGPYLCSPLGWAALTGRASLASALLGLGASVSAAAERGSLPLHMAVWNGDHAEVVSLLLKAGADASARNAKGLTALEVARQMHNLELSSAVEATYKLDEWRGRWGKPAKGRAQCMALLEAAVAAPPPAEGVAEGEGASDVPASAGTEEQGGRGGRSEGKGADDILAPEKMKQRVGAEEGAGVAPAEGGKAGMAEEGAEDVPMLAAGMEEEGGAEATADVVLAPAAVMATGGAAGAERGETEDVPMPAPGVEEGDGAEGGAVGSLAPAAGLEQGGGAGEGADDVTAPKGIAGGGGAERKGGIVPAPAAGIAQGGKAEGADVVVERGGAKEGAGDVTAPAAAIAVGSKVEEEPDVAPAEAIPDSGGVGGQGAGDVLTPAAEMAEGSKAEGSKAEGRKVEGRKVEGSKVEDKADGVEDTMDEL